MDDHFVPLGMRQVWGGERPFGISAADLRQHMHVIGMSGTGKTTLLKNMIVADLLAGRGLALLDPHGDLAEELLDLIPPWRADDLLYFDPADLEYPIGFNLLASVPPHRRHLVVSGIVSAFKSLWRDSFGPRMEYILANAVAALTECQNVSLLGISRMLVDESYRHWVIKQVHDPAVLQFWTQEFSMWDHRFRAEAIAPVLNKTGALLLSPALRNVLGQINSAFDLRWMMDHKRIFIANLSKGRLGEDKSSVLGALLVAQFQLAAMSRAEIPQHQRQDFHLYIDEFSSFTGDSFASILSEARKYRCSMILSHQHLSQLRPELVDSILGNVGTTISFRLGQSDAEILTRQFAGTYHADAFTSLGNHEVVVKSLEGGQIREPFSGKTLVPDHQVFGRREKLIRHCRERFAMPRKNVENKIERWMTFQNM